MYIVYVCIQVKVVYTVNNNYLPKDDIAFLAASSRFFANSIFNPDSSNNFLPAETFVPAKSIKTIIFN